MRKVDMSRPYPDNLLNGIDPTRFETRFPDNDDGILKAIRLFEHFGCLPKKSDFIEGKLIYKCCNCQENMTPVEDASGDIGHWILRCKHCEKKESMDQNTFFFDQNLTEWEALKLMVCFVSDFTSSLAEKACELEEIATMDCYIFFRKILGIYLSNLDLKIGGPGIIVEIVVNEHQITQTNKVKKSKNNVTKGWVVGGIERSKDGHKPKIFMAQIANCTTTVILNAIRHYVLPGSTVITNSKACYKQMTEGLAAIGIDHRMNKHSLLKSTNVDLKSPKINTNSANLLWGQFKSKLKDLQYETNCEWALEEFVSRYTFFIHNDYCDGANLATFLGIVAKVCPGPGKEAMKMLYPFAN
ncbi:hypothetical protein CHUAL_007008 [Chamberlinius hualienensis]